MHFKNDYNQNNYKVFVFFSFESMIQRAALSVEKKKSCKFKIFTKVNKIKSEL